MIEPEIAFLKYAVDRALEDCLEQLRDICGEQRLALIVYGDDGPLHISTNFDVLDAELYLRTLDHPARLLDEVMIEVVDGHQVERPPARRN